MKIHRTLKQSINSVRYFMVEQSNNNLLENVYKFNEKELDAQTGYYYYGARYYDPGASIFLSVDPLAEEFPEWNPYHYVHNNPVNLVDPTGMAAEGTPVKEKQTTGQMIYNHTGFKKSVDWGKKVVDKISSYFTTAKPDEVIRSKQDIGSSVYSKYGGGENDTTTGQQKGEKINVDWIIKLASGLSGPYKGNKYKELEDGLDFVKTVFSGYQQGEVIGESAEQTTKEILTYVKGVEIKGEGENRQTSVSFSSMMVEGTENEIEIKRDSLRKDAEMKQKQASK